MTPHATGHDWAAMGVPNDVAIAQARYDRFGAAIRMRQAGLKLREIASRFGVTTERARQLVLRGESKLEQPTPFDLWASDQRHFRDACMFMHRLLGYLPNPGTTPSSVVVENIARRMARECAMHPRYAERVIRDMIAKRVEP